MIGYKSPTQVMVMSVTSAWSTLPEAPLSVQIWPMGWALTPTS